MTSNAGRVSLLSRLRKLVFKIRHRSPAARFAESMRRVNRLARLMTIIQYTAANGRRADSHITSSTEGARNNDH
jgi:hypothetical protein